MCGRRCTCGMCTQARDVQRFDEFDGFEESDALDEGDSLEEMDALEDADKGDEMDALDEGAAADWADDDSMEDALDTDSDADQYTFGTDNRFQIRPRDRTPSTRLFPFNTVCMIRTSAGGICSGTLIAPRVVLTAKHCLFRNPGAAACGPMRSGRSTISAGAVTITPGLDQTSPIARRTPAAPARMIAPARAQFGHPTVDVGLIILPRKFRRPNRFMLLQPRSDAESVNRVVTLAGYPGDMPAGTMWAHSDRIRSATPTHFLYRIDLCPGQSGGPVWMLGAGETRILLAVQSVHTSSAVPPGQTNCGTWVAGAPIVNCGARLTCDVIRWILDICRRRVRQQPAVDAPTLRRCPRRAA
jgi:V8-like Glu-specific endopeptidase